ncbi:MAG TPA: class I SAM-dependent methyltransferase [Pirellulales bacterium]|nr:class I SAM-dependent methyltransferase [Pirellulales bacterium]
MNLLETESQRSAQEQINGSLYRRDDLVRQYDVQNLSPAESTALVRWHDAILGRRVLDLGCGAGRLATYLRPLVARYVGLDISAQMVAFCRARFAGLEFHQGDMRRLEAFADGSFDAVLGVFNLFDAVSHADRLRILAEVRRVLVPAGLLIFSAHNRNWAAFGDGPRFERSLNPWMQARYAVRYARCRLNYRRVRPHQALHDDCALVSDPGHNFAVLHYYITRQAQARQLDSAGFELLECLDELGRILGPDDGDRACSSLHYVARRRD